MTAEPRSRVGRHRLIAKLEQGGMAEVYLAAVEDRLAPYSGRAEGAALRVVKIMPKSMMSDPQLVEMFLDEARLAMRLGHPNVVQTMEVGRTADQCLFLAMEWLEGASLFRLVQRSRELDEELPAQASATIVLQVLDALHYLHELTDLDGAPLEVIHRDVTPSNLFITTAGHVKLLDFGIAKTAVQHAVTVVGTRKGKLPYLAPEQIAGQRFDRRVDVYSCGVVLWELLADRRLWRGAAQLDRSVAAPDLEDFAVPRALAAVCAKALARKPADRYPTALAMLEDLEAAAAIFGGPMRSAELARRLDQLVGEDVRNVRRLAANAVRNGRFDEAGERMVRAPEGTSVTVPPDSPASRGRLIMGGALGAAAVAAMLVALAPQALRPAAPPAPEARSPAALTAPVAPSAWNLQDSPQQVAPRSAVIRVEVRPPGAIVEIDGVRSAGPPHAIEVLADGAQHQVEVSAPGFAPRELHVVASDDVALEVNLVQLPSAEAPRPRARRTAAAPSSTAEISNTPATSSTAATSPAVRSRPMSSPRGVRELDPSDPW